MEQLLLLRHADAENVARSDKARQLTEKGREQARHVGRFCEEHKICPEVILASPYARTDETARIVAARLKVEMITANFLAPGMSPSTALEELHAYSRFRSVMLVGHEPDTSHLAAALLGVAGADALHVRKATLIGLDVSSLQPGAVQARLDFFLPVKLMSS